MLGIRRLKKVTKNNAAANADLWQQAADSNSLLQKQFSVVVSNVHAFLTVLNKDGLAPGFISELIIKLHHTHMSVTSAHRA